MYKIKIKNVYVEMVDKHSIPTVITSEHVFVTMLVEVDRIGISNNVKGFFSIHAISSFLCVLIR